MLPDTISSSATAEATSRTGATSSIGASSPHRSPPVKKGKPKYTSLHSLRHFYASWCINRRTDGGLELPLKIVQARLGHSSITLTADTYGYLFPRGDDGTELAAAERVLLG